MELVSGINHHLCLVSTTNQHSGHPYVCGKTFPAFPFSPATATVATERKNGNGTTAQRHGNGETAMAERQRNGGN